MPLRTIAPPAVVPDTSRAFQLFVVSGSDDRLWWKISCAMHETVATVRQRLIKGSGVFCPSLFHNGHELPERRTLEEIGINEFSVLSTGRSASIIYGKKAQRAAKDLLQHKGENKATPLWSTEQPSNFRTSLVDGHAPGNDDMNLLPRPSSSSAPLLNRDGHISRRARTASPPSLRVAAPCSEAACPAKPFVEAVLPVMASRPKSIRFSPESSTAMALKLSKAKIRIEALQTQNTALQTALERTKSKAPVRVGVRTPELPIDVHMFLSSGQEERALQELRIHLGYGSTEAATLAPGVLSSPSMQNSLHILPPPTAVPYTTAVGNGIPVAAPGLLRSPAPLYIQGL